MFTAALLTTATPRKHVHVPLTDRGQRRCDVHAHDATLLSRRERNNATCSITWFIPSWVVSAESLFPFVLGDGDTGSLTISCIFMRTWNFYYVLFFFYKHQTDCFSFLLFNVKYSFTVKLHCHRAYLPVCGRDCYASLNIHFLFFISHKTFSLVFS